MDEPCSALDPTSTLRIEQTIKEIADEVTVVIVTHNMQQAQRVSDYCAFFLAEENQPGRVVESRTTETIFGQPHRPEDARLCPRPIRLSRPAPAVPACAAAGRRRRGCLVVAVLAPARRARRRPGPARRMQSTGSSFAGVAIQQWVGQTQHAVRAQHQLAGVSRRSSASTTSPRTRSTSAPRTSPTARARPQSTPTIPYQYMPDVAGGSGLHVQPQRERRPADQQPDPQRPGHRRDLPRARSPTWNDPAIAQLNPQLRGRPARPPRSSPSTAPTPRARTTCSPTTCCTRTAPTSPPPRTPFQTGILGAASPPPPGRSRRPAGPRPAGLPRVGRGQPGGPERLGQRRQLRLGRCPAQGRSPTWRRPTPRSTTSRWPRW